jgi:hypothetical protein
MKTTILNLNDKASEVVNYLMDPEVLANRTDTLEELLDLLFDECNAPDIGDSETLRLARELRWLIRDLTTIKNSLITSNHDKEQ